MRGLIDRVIAVFLALALWLLSPGIASYEALAQSGRSSKPGVSFPIDPQSPSAQFSPNSRPPANLGSLGPRDASNLPAADLRLNPRAELKTARGNFESRRPFDLPGTSLGPAAETSALATNPLPRPMRSTADAPIGPADSMPAPDAGIPIRRFDLAHSVLGFFSRRDSQDPSRLRMFFDRGHMRGSEPVPAAPADGETNFRESVQELGRPAFSKTPAPGTKIGEWSGRIARHTGWNEFNASEKWYLASQALYLLSLSLYIISLPVLVIAVTGQPDMVGTARMVHYWVIAFFSLFSGSLIRQRPMKGVLLWAFRTRAFLLGTIGLLALGHGLPAPILLGLIAINAAVVSVGHLVDPDAKGLNEAISTPEKRERALYLYKFLKYSIFIPVMLLAGIPMDWADQRYGIGVGAMAGFGLFSAIMLGASFLIKRYVVITTGDADPKQPAPRPLLQSLREAPRLVAQTLAAMWHNKIILSRSIITVCSELLGDALQMVVLPIFAIDVLRGGNNANARLQAAGFIGGWLASFFLIGRAKKTQDRIGTYPFVKRLTFFAFLGWIPSLLFWINILPASPFWQYVAPWLPFLAVVLIRFLYDPIESRHLALLQHEVRQDPRARPVQDTIFSLITTIETIAAGAGGYFLSRLFDPGSTLSRTVSDAFSDSVLPSLLGAYAPMKVITLILLGISLAYALILPLLKKQLLRSYRSASTADEGLKKIRRAVAWGFRGGWKGRAALVSSGGSDLLKGTWDQLRGAPTGQELRSLRRLKENLARMGLPPPFTMRIKEAASSDRPTVAIMAPPSVHKLSVLQEGGRQAPADVHLVLDPSWIIQEVGLDGRNRLLLKKGLYFNASGEPVLAEYEAPRRIRYFGNFYTPGANGRGDGIPMEENLDTPMSSSHALEHITNEKLTTRLLAAARGVAVPATLAFLMAGHPLFAKAERLTALPSSSSSITIVPMPEASEPSREEARKLIEEYLHRFPGEEVVVKPSGPYFHSARGVRFFRKTDLDEIVDHVLALAHKPWHTKDGEAYQMTPDGAVLIDERLASSPLYLRFDPNRNTSGNRWVYWRGEKASPDILSSRDIAAEPADKKDWNLRVLVSATPWGAAKVDGIFGRAGTWGLPTNAEPDDPKNAAAFIRFEHIVEALQTQHGLLKTRHEILEFRSAIERAAEQTLLAIREHESKRTREEGEPYQARTDFIGLDFMFTVARENGKLVPSLIEVNDHDAGGQRQLDLFYPDQAGRHSRHWIADMLARARRDALRGKRILLVGAGDNAHSSAKQGFFERARRLGMHVVLMDQPGTWARDYVDDLIPVDTSEAMRLLRHDPQELLRRVGKAGRFDGITTFWEDDVVFTSELAEKLGLQFHAPGAARLARNKLEMRRALQKAGRPSPMFFPASSPEELTRAIQELKKAAESLGKWPPMVLKPWRGAEAEFVLKTGSPNRIWAAHDEISRRISASENPIFREGRELMLEEYLDGQELDVDVVLQNDQVVYGSVTENHPTREPHFLATGSSSPPRRLTEDQQKEAADAALADLRALGFRNGPFHVEMKYTSRGPMLLEVNARPGGSYVTKWNLEVWGVDLIEMLYLTAAGIPATAFKSPAPLKHLEGVFLIPARSGTLEGFDGLDGVRSLRGFHDFVQFKKAGERIRIPGDALDPGYERAAMLVAEGGSSEEAGANLDRLTAALRMNVGAGNPGSEPFSARQKHPGP
ncbi:MAG: ATP-grasp domain-containing protein [Elusimicrobia bacterium]|nr:ATP-grasp domain-containing protein [Elusimicrobiota bacterium]